MAVDAFITFEKASVGSEPEGFEIEDFSFGIENPTTIGSATGGAGAGKIKFNEFTIKKTADRASATFFKNCCAGAHYKSVIIHIRKAGGDPAASRKEFLRFKFGTVFTTKIDWSGPGDEGPEESITFVYGKLAVKFIPQEPGSQPVAAGWDQVLNQDAQDFAEG
jgi:type VI secretion system secreted protein Hcp